MSGVVVLGEAHAPAAFAQRAIACSLETAARSLGVADPLPADAPRLARRLRDAGAAAVCVAGVPRLPGQSLTWLDSDLASGWLAPRGGGVAGQQLGAFARHWAAALDLGFVAPDAAVLAVMATSAGEQGGDAFVHEPALLPALSWGEAPVFHQPAPRPARRLGLYAIVDGADRLQQVLAAGVTTVQLRIKTPAVADDAWHALLRREVERSIAVCRAAGAELYVNDHWRLARELGAWGAHLGQEDLAALADDERAALHGSALALGVSSHSLWELARAGALAPRYIACGPVWPTQTKDMPWLPQGADNLAWWCRMAPAPVVAIGGILQPPQVREAARCGADGVCLVRGLGERPQDTVPVLQAALDAGWREHATTPPARSWPHPSLRPAP